MDILFYCFIFILQSAIIKFYINVLDIFDINIICYGSITRCFGLVAGLDFILVSEYGENC